MIVGHKVGVFPDLTEAVKSVVKVDEVIQPNEEWAKVYDQLYPYYVNMYQSLDANLRALRQTVTDIQKDLHPEYR